jgi:cytochrome c5
MQRVAIALTVLLVTPLQAAPWARGSPKAGEALHARSCTACHDTQVYTRADRKIKTPAQLAARISGCNANTGAGWFPEDEQHVGAYLNQQFYHFK